MSKLQALLEDTEFFEAVTSEDSGDSSHCVGRALDPRLWIEFLQVLLYTEKQAVEKGDISEGVLDVLKVYYLSDGGKLQYLWKISCYKMSWLSSAFPRVPKADWAKGFNIEIDLSKEVNTIPLVSSTPATKYPHPRELGHLGIVDMSGNE